MTLTSPTVIRATAAAGTAAETACLPCGYHSGPGEIDTVYVLDVDGLIMVWNTSYYAGTPAEDVAELEAIVQSASFGE